MPLLRSYDAFNSMVSYLTQLFLSKLQTPNSKLQTPNSKLQTPNSKLQTPNSKLQTPNPLLLRPAAFIHFISCYKINVLNRRWEPDHHFPIASVGPGIVRN